MVPGRRDLLVMVGADDPFAKYIVGTLFVGSEFAQSALDRIGILSGAEVEAL
jgi:hypothetical protein